MLRIALAEGGSRTDASDAHLAHMALHRFAIDDELVVLLERHRDAPRAIRRLIGVNPVNGMLDGDLFRGWRHRLIVQTASAQAQQVGLVRQGKFGRTAFDQGEPLTSGQGRGQIFFVATRPGS